MTEGYWLTWAPCGCLAGSATADYLENSPRDMAAFLRDNIRTGDRSERVSSFDREQLMMCSHDPKWGGRTTEWWPCTECSRVVKVTKAGVLAAHKPDGCGPLYADCKGSGVTAPPMVVTA